MISSFFDDVNSLDCYTEYLSIFRWWSHHFNPLSYCDVTPPPPPLRRTPRLLLLSYFPHLWLLEWGCNGLKNVTKGLRDVKEGGISARKAGLLWGLSMKKSTLQVRLNRRVTFDRRVEVPSPSLSVNKKWRKKVVCRLANWACKLRLRHVHGCLP